MKPGETLEVLGTDPKTLKNFPPILKNGNDRIVEVKEYLDYHRLLIRKG
jgi:TusA-related sulfurtransferase